MDYHINKKSHNKKKFQLLVEKIIPCRGLNPGPPTLQSAALPYVLSYHIFIQDYIDLLSVE